MTTVTFFSSKGAPGTTTAAMLVASLWPRPALLADCDPAGGDVGLRLPSPTGGPLDLGRGMLSLLPVARRSLEPGVLLDHTQQALGGGEVLVGMSGPEQAAAVGPLWATIGGAFAGLSGHDAIIDVGRLDSRSPVMPLVVASSLAVCVIDSTLASVFSARARLRTLIPLVQGADRSGPLVGLIVQSAGKREAEAAGAVIQGEFPNVTYLGRLSTDRVGARIFDGRPVSRPERTMLARSGAEVVGAIQNALSRLVRGRVDAAEQSRQALTDAHAAYLPYLVPSGPDNSAPPPRSRSQERRVGQSRRFHRARRGSGGPS